MIHTVKGFHVVNEAEVDNIVCVCVCAYWNAGFIPRKILLTVEAYFSSHPKVEGS